MILEGQTQTAAAVELRRATLDDRDALLAMYRTFEPKGAALGLPPQKEEATQRWLDRLAGSPNFLAWAEGHLVGHAVLCPDGDEAEVAVFVHQDHRGRGIGRRLLGELVLEGQRLGLRRLWGITETDNIAMLRLASSCGFVAGPEPGEFYVELEKAAELPEYASAA